MRFVSATCLLVIKEPSSVHPFSFSFMKSSAALGCPRLSNFYSLCLPPLADALVSCLVTRDFSVSSSPGLAPPPHPSPHPALL